MLKRIRIIQKKEKKLKTFKLSGSVYMVNLNGYGEGGDRWNIKKFNGLL